MGDLIDIRGMLPKRLDNPPNRIREWRNRRGLTLAQLAERVGTTYSQISRFEIGDRTVDLEWLRRIARELHVSVGDLINADDNPMHAQTEEEQMVLEAMRRGAAERMAVRIALEITEKQGVAAEEPEKRRA